MRSDDLIRPTIPSRFLADLFEQSGVDPASALPAIGLPVDALALSRLRISVEQFERAYGHVCRACDDEGFGYFRHPIPRGTYAVAIWLATGVRRLSGFFEASSRLYGLFDGHHRIWSVTREGERALVRVTWRTDAQARSVFLVHLMLVTPMRSAAWLVGEHVPARAVRLDPRFVPYRSQTAFLFGCEPDFVEGAAEVEIDADWLDAPVRRTPDEADRYVRASFHGLLSAPPGDVMESRVRAALAQALAPGASARAATIAAVARKLHLSRATLARRLAERHLTFQAIKDDLRRDHAIALLAETTVTIAEIAERIGFSEPSAFTRAFRSWTGLSPAAYRRAPDRC